MAATRRISRRDVILVVLGASLMHFSTILAPLSSQIKLINNVSLHSASPENIQILLPPPRSTPSTTIPVSSELLLAPDTPELDSVEPESNVSTKSLQETSIIAHAPGWTLFRNLYMSNSTLFIVTDSSSDFPQTRFMTSNPVKHVVNTPENLALRRPTPYDMDFISYDEAQRRWSGDSFENGDIRVSTVKGNTVLINEPRQFLRHYYHFVAELFFGVQAFWHGAFSAPSSDANRDYSQGPYPAPPPIHRIIFMHADAYGWRDDPGFNAYFLRAAFRNDRAWHFPLVLLADRFAAHRGQICGVATQRIAAEAVEAMRTKNQLVGARVGGWWAPVRNAVLQFARAELPENIANSELEQAVDVYGESTNSPLPMPKKVVVTYISRQFAGHRKLAPESHTGLVEALEDLAKRRDWEVNIMTAERKPRDEQLQIISRTTILVGVHGNGLTHLVMLPPTRISAVIEIFYPRGFAHDYQWTSTALGIRHFAFWNDTFRTAGVGEGKPPYSYPEGFQLNHIPVHGPAVVQLIEDHVEGKFAPP
ncbi:hypothetical protein R3P38DRAFT_3257072 [Favolaschia claudopus]|uniref:Glycosyltransferase 61 catalytic domain-containing protein n=1 Tax=Favolaschia claudopus TaxID=2862362 RepID=A0AAW0DBZ9_9AGAR